jgi:predicted Zn finger-like uncharacterized protein
MKFLCPSCKAKYQIADEKVAGRSVRMKCRKCGFMIQVSSAGGPGTASTSEPPDVEGGSSAPPPAPKVAAASATEAVAAPLKPAPIGPGRSLPGRASALPAPRPPPGKALGIVPKPGAPPARPSTPKAAPAPAPAPVAGAAVAASSPSAAKATAAAALPTEYEDDEITRMADAGALAGAFTQAFGGSGADAPPTPEVPLSMPGDEWFVGINGVPVGPIRLSELRSKAAAGAVNKESLVWRDGFEDWRPLKTYPELVAIVEEGVSSARASLTPFTPAASEALEARAVDTFATAPSPSAVTGSAVVTDELAGLLPRRRGTSPMVWVAMVIAIGLGLTIGFVVFGGQKAPETKIVEKIVEVPAKGNEPASPTAANNAIEETSVAADPNAAKRSGASGKPAATPDGESKGTNTGLKGLTGLSGLGPSGGPVTGGPSGAVGGGGQLDGGQIQSTVSRYTGSVKRRCWQPALDARARDAPMTAKVTVTITVGPSGSVQNATTTGDPRGYSGLANCIASSVRAWSFPASGGTTIANVPFVFAGQ